METKGNKKEIIGWVVFWDEDRIEFFPSNHYNLEQIKEGILSPTTIRPITGFVFAEEENEDGK